MLATKSSKSTFAPGQSADIPPAVPGGFLGTTAKSRAIEERQGFAGSIDKETGEITLPPGTFDGAKVRAERFALQSVSRSILPNSRTAACLRHRAKGREIEVYRSTDFGSTSFGGLQTCGSVWACPVCAAKIAERRRAEIQSAVAIHEAQGGHVLLLTLTNPHYASTRLSELLEGQRKALHAFMRNRSGRDWFRLVGCNGHIRTLEVTHGANGWHPHFHILLFCRTEPGTPGCAGGAPVGPGAVRLGADVWRQACLRAGLPVPSYEHGFRLDDGSKAAKYVAKWGLEDEMTKGHIKKGRKESETPFDLLRRVLASSADKEAARLFREFAAEFKGARQLVWSRGLKDRFQVVEVDDDEISQRLEEEAVVLGRITLAEWRRVLAVEGRALVLELARSGWDPVRRYLDGLMLEAPS